MSEDLPDIVRDTELATTIHGEHTVHSRLASSRSGKSKPRKVEETWRRDRKLGQSNAIVWQETCVAGKKWVGSCRAVKEIWFRTPKFSMAKVARELVAIGRLSQERYRHHFVRSFGWYRTEDSVFIAMEYMEHGDLSGYLSQPLPEVETLDITHQLLKGLEVMHDLGFVHRDLKPQNVLVKVPGPNWYVKLADFGISKKVHEESNQTAERGTYSYMAPESLTGQLSGRYAFAVDMWSLGVIVAEMLTGKRLFSSAHDVITWQPLSGGQTLPAHEWLFKSSDGPVGLILQCLTVSPSERITVGDALQYPWILTYEDHENGSDSESENETSEAPFLDVTGASSDRSSPLPGFPASLTTRPRSAFTASVTGGSEWRTKTEDRSEVFASNQTSSTTATPVSTLWSRSQQETASSISPGAIPDAVKPQLLTGVASDAWNPTGSASTKAVRAHAARDAVKNPYEGGDDENDEFDEKITKTVNGYQGKALLEAAENGNLDQLNTLLRWGTFVNFRDDSQCTALHKASREGHFSIVEALIQGKARVNARDSYGLGETPLHMAARGGHVQVMKLLIAARAWMEIPNLQGRTPLHEAVSANKLEAVHCLLDCGHALDPVDTYQTTPLAAATILGLSDIAEKLIVVGASRLGRDPDGTMLHLAAYRGHIDIMRALIYSGPGDDGSQANINAVNLRGQTALMYAVSNKQAGAVKILLHLGASVDIVDADGDTPLHEAAMRSTGEIANLLVSHGAHLDAVNNAGQTPLMMATEAKNKEVAAGLAVLEGAADGNKSQLISQLVSHVLSPTPREEGRVDPSPTLPPRIQETPAGEGTVGRKEGQESGSNRFRVYGSRIDKFLNRAP